MRWLIRGLQTSVDQAKEVVKNPRSAGSMMRGAALRLWRARGGGFYGLGYLICFGVLQARSFTSDVNTSDGLGDFVTGQVTGFLMRVTVDSLSNALQAFLWPLLVLAEFGAAGFAVILVGFLVFERWLRPAIETWLPDLREPAPGRHKAPPD